MSGCPSTVDLDRAAMRLASGEAAPESIARHVEGCETCARLLEEMARNAGLSDEFGRLAPAARRRGDEALADMAPGYRMIRELHRGGQGVVYEAMQEGSNRRVAVKMLLQGGFATTRQRLRFEREIQIAANLRHPGIVTVYEALSLADGRLGYAMELIEGERLDAWAEGVRGEGLSGASVRRMMRVFSGMCDAVAYAHGRAIVHRDLKPANVLVESGDVARVLDFGIAKATEAGESDAGRSTRTGEFLGTLAYAAPEQVGGGSELVDVRTDVYALGLMLHEMLTGTTGRAMSGSMAEVVEGIMAASPGRRPSAVAGGVIDDDVDVIVMTATAREPERRYATVGALRDDVEAWLAGRAISAKRDSRLYVLGKAMRRHRVALVVATVILALVAGFVVQLVVNNRELQRKTSLSHQGLQLRGELDEIARLLDREVGTVEAKLEQIAAVRPRLDGIADGIAARFGSEPLLEAGLHGAAGDMYREMAIFEPAQRHMEAALAIRRRVQGVSNEETLQSMKALAELYRELGEIQGGERTEASRALLEEAVEVSRGMYGVASETTSGLMANLARVYFDERDYERSQALYVEALAGLRGLGLGDSVDALRCETGLGLLEHERAKRLRRSADESERARGVEADAAARAMLDAALVRQRTLLGDRDLLTQKTMNNLALAYVLSGDASLLVKAEDLWANLLEARERTLGRLHKRTLTAQANLGELYVDMGEAHAAIGLLPGAIEGMRTVYGEENPNVPYLMSKLGEAYRMAGRLEEAEGTCRDAVVRMRRVVPASGARRGEFLAHVGGLALGHVAVLEEMGRLEEARAVLEGVLAELEAELGPEDGRVREVRGRLEGLSVSN